MRDLPERICLVGFMGAGKTTVGRLLARRLGFDFVDLDALIAEQAGMSIPLIFQGEGEAGFRARESACIASLRVRSGIVIAAGGGAPMAAENREFFSGLSTTFFLSVSLKTALGRAPRDGRRPMLDRSAEEVQELFDSRRAVYETVGKRIDTEGKRPEEIAREIESLL